MSVYSKATFNTRSTAGFWGLQIETDVCCAPPRRCRRKDESRSHEWEGETLVEHSKSKLRGATLLFERRLTFSEGADELQIVERAESPSGRSETSSSLPLK